MALHHRKQKPATDTAASPRLAELAAATAELSRLERHQRELVAQARSEGCSWAEVAAATGVSPHAARKRWPSVAAGSMVEVRQAEVDFEVSRDSQKHMF
jgi:DNA-directed RNA polymerase specialized sigma24 family protein